MGAEADPWNPRASPGRRQPAPLYRRLPHGPNGMTRDEVARNQRTRIFGGMIESVARRGYAETTVADVIALAGVSRRAFYELFANKEDCFLATHDVIMARARRNMIDAWRGDSGFHGKLHASCAALTEHVSAEPDGAKLALVEMPAAGAVGHERTQLALAAFEQLVAAAFRAAPDGVSLPPLAARAIVGGSREVIAERLRGGRAAEVRGLTGELLDWAGAYATPLAGRLGALQAPARAGAHALVAGASHDPGPGLLLTADARARALEALTLLALERSGAGFTDAEIARRAGMSTEAFHREFASRDACFLALLDDFSAEGASAARAASRDAASWPELVLQAMDGFIGHMLDHLEVVRIAFVHAAGAGAAVAGRLVRSVAGLLDTVTDRAPAAGRGAPVLRPALAGAVWAILASCAGGLRLARLARIVHQLAFIVVAPYLGPRAAVQALQKARLPASAR